MPGPAQAPPSRKNRRSSSAVLLSAGSPASAGPKFSRISEDTFMIRTLLSIAAVAFLVSACGDDASKKAPSGATTPPPAEKEAEPKK
jgi:hypothetical protein